MVPSCIRSIQQSGCAGSPGLAHALLVERKDGTFLVGVRAPISKPQGAEKLYIKFSGVGRAVAGINNLAPEEVDRFFDAFDLQFTI